MSNNINICLLFFGIGRGVSVTSRIYKKEIFDSLKNSNIRFKSYYLLNQVDYISNNRSKDFGEVEIPNDGCFFEEERFIVNPALLDVEDNFVYSKLFKDRHEDDYVSNKNLLYQLCMLSELYNRVDFSQYTHIFLLRDDCALSIDMQQVLNQFIIPNKYFLLFSKWNIENGICDRFLLGPTNLVIPFLLRVNHVRESIQKSGYLNGEELMWFVLKKLSLPYVMLNIKIKRVRLDLSVKNERFSFPWWRPRDACLFIYNELKLIYFNFIAPLINR